MRRVVPLWLGWLCQGFPLLQPTTLQGENKTKAWGTAATCVRLISLLIRVSPSSPPPLKKTQTFPWHASCTHQRIDRSDESRSCTCASRDMFVYPGHHAEMKTLVLKPELRVWLLSVYSSLQSQHHHREALHNFSLYFTGKKNTPASGAWADHLGWFEQVTAHCKDK